jgi:hypothetical protein
VRRVSDIEKRKHFENLVSEEMGRYTDNIVSWAEWFFENFADYTSSIDMENDFSQLPYE